MYDLSVDDSDEHASGRRPRAAVRPVTGREA
jgi:hypothetical protein